MITFYKRTEEEYNNLTPVTDGIYFITDKNYIILNGIKYGSNISLVKNFPETGEFGKVYINIDTKEQQIYTQDGWQQINNVITSNKDDILIDNLGVLPDASAIYSFIISELGKHSNENTGTIYQQVNSVLDVTLIENPKNNSLISVKGNGLFKFNLYSNDIVDGITILSSGNLDKSGRWIRIMPEVNISLDNTLVGDGFIYNKDRLTLNINLDHFQLIDGKLNLSTSIIEKINKINEIEDTLTFKTLIS